MWSVCVNFSCICCVTCSKQSWRVISFLFMLTWLKDTPEWLVFFSIPSLRCQPESHHRLLRQSRRNGPVVWPPEGEHRAEWRHCHPTRKLHQSESKPQKKKVTFPSGYYFRIQRHCLTVYFNLPQLLFPATPDETGCVSVQIQWVT